MKNNDIGQSFDSWLKDKNIEISEDKIKEKILQHFIFSPFTDLENIEYEVTFRYKNGKSIITDFKIVNIENNENDENNLLKMFLAMITDRYNYDKRKVAEKTKVGKFKISSCYTSDMGYETAIGYKDEFYPVERYKTEDDCIEGHNKWIKWAKSKPKVIPYLQFDNKTIKEVEI